MRSPSRLAKWSILSAIILAGTIAILYWVSGSRSSLHAQESNQQSAPANQKATSPLKSAHDGVTSTTAGTQAGTTSQPAGPSPTSQGGSDPLPPIATPYEPEPQIDLSTHYVLINGQRAHPYKLIAKYKTDPSSRQHQILDQLNLRVQSSFPLTPAVVVLRPKNPVIAPVASAAEAEQRGKELEKWINTLTKSGEFEYVEPDYIVTTDAVPTDQAFADGTLWGLRNIGQSGGVAGADIGATQAWDTTTGSTAIVVAVIDTGIRYTHQDLTTQMWQNPDEIAANGLDDDQDGYIDNIYGINGITNSGDPSDDHGHGTHCAGTIGAQANGGGPHVGVAWSVKLMACRFMARTTDGRASGSTSDAIKCINFAAAKGANILNNSWGGGGFSQALSDAITAANASGVLFVAAAGNASTDTDTTPHYPSAYPHANVVCVAAIDRQDKLAYFSNYGVESVDLGAPGVNVYSCTSLSDSSYATWNGTSMAAPHVCGVAALVLATAPDLSAAELRQRILESAVPIPALQGKTATGARLNAPNAIAGEPDGILEVSVLPASGAELRGGADVSFFVTVRDFAAVQNATVIGAIAGSPNVTFANDGVAPDITANDNIYSATLRIPSDQPTFNVEFQISAPGKTTATAQSAYSVLLPPPNDHFAARITMTGNTTVTGSSALASRETGEPKHGGYTTGKSAWWSWTAAATGMLTLSTDGSSFDTLLAVYTGTSLNSLISVASDRDSGTGLASLVSMMVTAGTTYQIAVDGENGSSGSITLTSSFALISSAPSNDDFADAAALAGANPTTAGSNFGATKEADEPSHGGATGGRSVWWTWTAPGSGVATITTDGSLFDTTLGVYVGSSLDTLTKVASDNDSGEGTRSSVSFSITEGTAYRIAVDGYNGASGNVSLAISLTTSPSAPGNDAFVNRTTVAGTSAAVVGTTLGGTKETGEPDHAGNSGGKSAWWTWTAPSNGTAVISTAGSNFDTLLGVYTGSSVELLSPIASNDQDPLGGQTSRVIFEATAGTTYQIAVDGANTGLAVALGSVSLNIALGTTTAPSNDAFAQRTPVTDARATVTGSNIGATRELGEPIHYNSSATKSVWWSWVAPTTGLVAINTIGSNFDTVLAVYTGNSITALTLKASNDDYSSYGSQVVVSVIAGTYYQIAVAGNGGSSGAVTLNINPVVAAPVFTTHPSNQNGYPGDYIYLSGSASSSTAVTYRWQKDGADLADSSHIYGAASQYLAIYSATVEDSGQYTLVATNPGGSTTSNAATVSVTVPPAPVITTQPTSRAIYRGQSVSFSVGLTVTGRTTYQWQKSTDGGSTFTNIPYATGSEVYFWETIATDAAQYRVIVTNPGGSTTSNAATLSFNTPPAPVISTHPIDQTVYRGLTINLSVSSSVTGTTTYQWQKSTDGGSTFINIANATSPYFGIYSATASDAAQYRVVVTNPGGSTASNAATITVNAPPLPVITRHPTSQTIYLGQTISLDVGISDTGPVTYQWQKSTDGGTSFNNIAGQTSYSLYIYSSQNSDAGQYRVVITNTTGSTTSNAATITFVTPPAPVINSQPTNRSGYPGAYLDFYASVTSHGTTSYQWQKSTDGGSTFSNITNATYTSLYFSNLTSSDAGHYRLVITNAGGTVTSNVVTMTVLVPPAPIITEQPQNLSVYLGESFSLRASVSSSGSCTYQWQKSTDGGATFNAISNATNSSYSIYSAQSNNAGQYRLRVTNGGGTAISNTVTVTVNTPPPPLITAQPASQTIYLGASFSVSVTASSIGPMTYQWQKSTDAGVTFTNIQYETWSTFSISSTQLSNAGQYRVVVTNAGGSVTSDAATIAIGVPPPPVITTQPATQSIYIGASINLSVSASVTGTTTYQWQKSTDGGATFVNIENATYSYYSIYTSQASDAAHYRVVVTNAGGSTPSNVAIITMVVPEIPTFTTHPQSAALAAGAYRSLYASATGNGRITNKWQKSTDGGVTFVDIPNAIWNDFSLYSARVADSGQYRMVATNAGGSAYSNPAVITVSPPPTPTITTHPASVTVVMGNAIYLSVQASGINLAYQWQKDDVNLSNGTRISGATSSSLAIYSSQLADAGQYKVIVSNEGGSITSNTVTVSITLPPPPVFPSQPSNLAVDEGSGFQLYANANGNGSITYQWYKDGTAISGATSNYYSKTATQSDAGKYKVSATNAGGTTFSPETTVTVTPATVPVFVIQPQNHNAYVGGSVTFTAIASARPSPSYQWYRNDTAITGQTSAALTLSNLTTSSNGASFTVKASNVAGSTTSNPAVLSIFAVDSSNALSIAPASRLVGCGRVVYPISLRCASTWNVTKSAPWITVSAMSGKYNRSLEVTVAPNPLPIERTATITIGGQTHTVTQRSAGTPISELWAVGGNDFGQLGDFRLPRVVPAQADSSVKAVAAGGTHTLYVTTDGTARVMGHNAHGELGDGSMTDRLAPVVVGTNVRAVAAGAHHSLLLKEDGSAWAAGLNDDGQIGDGTRINRLTFVQVASGVTGIAAGSHSSYIVKSDGSLWACGDNVYGQLGDGTTIDRSTFVQIATGVSSVAAGDYHLLFVKTNGTAWAAGYNYYGQLGDGTSVQKLNPVQIATAVRSVSAGRSHSMFVKSDNNLFGCGSSELGQVGLGSSRYYSPIPVASNVQSVSCGADHTLFITTGGSLRGCGNNQDRQLAEPAGPTITYPVTLATNVQAAAGGSSHSMYIKTDGTLWALGSNTSGQLGYGGQSFETRSSPINIASEVQAAACGDTHSMFVKTDGSAWSVGSNGYGELGAQWPTQMSYEHLPIATSARAVAAGYRHSLLIKNDDSLWVAGYNYFGQLGLGNSDFSNTLRQVNGTYNMATGGGAHSVFLRTDNSLWTTGNNYYGQLGNGTTQGRNTPQQVTGSYSSAAAADRHSLFLRSDKTVWAAGENTSGQLGDGTTLQRVTPVQISGLYNMVSAGYRHSLFLKTDGTAWAAGDNTFFQLGDGTAQSRRTSTQVMTNVRTIAAGESYSLFLKNDNTLWGCGDSSSGQLGQYLFRSTSGQVAANVQRVAAGSTHILFVANGDVRTTGVNLPTITSFSPTNVAAGTQVTITGSNFGGLVTVYFNGIPATAFTYNPPNSITATVPNSTTPGRIIVSTFDGYATSATDYNAGSGGGPSSGASGGGGGGGGAMGLCYLVALAALATARRVLVLARRR